MRRGRRVSGGERRKRRGVAQDTTNPRQQHENENKVHVHEFTLIPSALPADPLNAASMPFCVSSLMERSSRAGVFVPDAKGVMLNPGVISPLPPAP